MVGTRMCGLKFVLSYLILRPFSPGLAGLTHGRFDLIVVVELPREPHVGNLARLHLGHDVVARPQVYSSAAIDRAHERVRWAAIVAADGPLYLHGFFFFVVLFFL